jgi:hypothetical protein
VYLNTVYGKNDFSKRMKLIMRLEVMIPMTNVKIMWGRALFNKWPIGNNDSIHYFIHSVRYLNLILKFFKIVHLKYKSYITSTTSYWWAVLN